MDSCTIVENQFWENYRSGNYAYCLEQLSLSSYADSSPVWRFVKGEVLRRLDRFREAENELLLAHHVSEDKRDHLEVSLAQLYVSTGRFGDAEEWYRRAIRNAPGNTTAWIYLAELLMTQERIEEAKSALGHVPPSDSLSDEVAFMLGRCERMLDNLEGAQKWMAKSLDLCPTSKKARVQLADIGMAMELRRDRLSCSG